MTLYVGTKIVDATPMNRQDYNDYRGWTLPVDEDGGDEGFLVEYLDGGESNVPDREGYVSWSPKEVFINSYAKSGSMNLGAAILLMKAGFKLARAGWNGKGMFIYYVPPGNYPVQTKAARSQYGEVVPYQEYTAFSTAQNIVVPWLCSQTDMYANDWGVVE